MSEKDKRKLCWNCEGSVLRHLETCPYCGVYLSPSEQDLNSHSLLPPFPKEEPKESFDPIYQTAPEEESQETESLESEEVKDDGGVYTLAMLLGGTSFLLFGASLWLFSDKGILTLSWSQDWAPVFLLVAVPLLVFGGRSLVKLKN